LRNLAISRHACIVRQTHKLEGDRQLQVVIYHPAAIGDVVLATPVARALKEHLGECRIIHMSHESLFPLLACCPYIDELVAATGALVDQRSAISLQRAEYVVNLSGSLKSKAITWGTAPNVVHYRKEVKPAPPMMHAVENFLATLLPWRVTAPQVKFPTLSREQLPALPASIAVGSVALAPGVGALRPHRAWPETKWIELGMAVLEKFSRPVCLVGGEAERQLCERIAGELGKECTNLAGKLTLPETAAALSAAGVLVSGDTGPAHIAVATGTKVIGLYGPTFAERSGPYGHANQVISVWQDCQCKRLKQCKFKLDDGRCMDLITYEAVYELLLTALDGTVAKSMQ
jgi:ADP-heptose:LPS heptosyltransferase